MLGLAQQPLQLGWLAWFGMVPFIFIINKISKPIHLMVYGLLWGIFYYFTVIFWLAFNIGTTPIIGLISMIVAVLYCSITPAIICLVIGLIKRRYYHNWIWSFPFIWTSIEYIRNLDIFSGGPWTSLANSQIDFITIAQNVEITGIYGLTFWIVFLNISIFNWINKPYTNSLFMLFIIFIFPWISGFILMPVEKEKSKSLDIAIVQPNIHLSEKWKPGGFKKNINKLISMSKTPIEENIDLIIWPESATSINILKNNETSKYLKNIKENLNKSQLLTGIPYYIDNDEGRNFYNSIGLITKKNKTELYHKIILVPLAEYIPFSDQYPDLKKINIGQANFTSGNNYKIFNINKTVIDSFDTSNNVVNVGAMVCIESTIPNLSRKFVELGAEVLIYVVNDGWYESPPQPQQHSKQVIYRAIENRRPIIRCANTGISMLVNSSGNISHDLQLNKKGVIQATIFPRNELTFYTKYGDIFAWLCNFISILFILGSIIRKK